MHVAGREALLAETYGRGEATARELIPFPLLHAVMSVLIRGVCVSHVRVVRECSGTWTSSGLHGVWARFRSVLLCGPDKPQGPGGGRHGRLQRGLDGLRTAR